MAVLTSRHVMDCVHLVSNKGVRKGMRNVFALSTYGLCYAPAILRRCALIAVCHATNCKKHAYCVSIDICNMCIMHA